MVSTWCTMKLSIAALLAIVALASGSPVQEGGYVHPYKITDKAFLAKYKDVLRLFKYINQHNYYKEYVDMAKNFHLETVYDSYTMPQVAKTIYNYYKNEQILPRDEIFSIFYEEHLKQAVALFKLFYYAKDYDTFFKTAVWARHYLNQGLFLYSFSVALIHRPDTYGMVLPPIYEIYPYYFFNTEVIEQAKYYKQVFTGTTPPEGYTIKANYTGWYLNVPPEQSITYFTEDVGLNAYYYYYNLYHPFWMDYKEFNVQSYNRGEEFYYFYQQLIARYYLERLSNDFGEIPNYDYEAPFEVGYYPSMIYPNGLGFTERPNFAKFLMNYYNYGQSYSYKTKLGYSYMWVTDYERRIRDAIDSKFVITYEGKKIDLMEPHGFNMLGNIIEGNKDSPHYHFYGYLQIFARHLLGYSFQPLNKYKVAPSALQHFETSMRDPAFWMFFKRMIIYMQKFKYYLKPYTYDDLYFPGVKVEKMDVDRLITYFDHFHTDVTYSTFFSPEEWEKEAFHVRAQQYRLNHKPFTYKIYVRSDKDVKSVVRVFIGPKYDEYGRYLEMEENRLNFVEFDRFTYDLKSGENTIERNSRQTFYSSDRTTWKQLWEYAISGQFGVDGSEVYYSFPNRLLLPKGKHGGLTYQFYVMVSPYKPLDDAPASMYKGGEYEYFKYPFVGLGCQRMDAYPLGYPFDKPLEEEYSYSVPNSYFYDIVIYNRNYDEINSSNPTSRYQGRYY